MTGRRTGHTKAKDLPTPQNCNGNVMCAIDTETTGLKPGYHDIVQIAIVVLDDKYQQNKAFLPFYTDLKPMRPGNANPRAMKVNKLKIDRLLVEGIEPWDAVDMLEEWFKRLGLAERKRIIPVGHNYKFDESFMRSWLDHDVYERLFHYEVRDTKNVAAFLNDRAWWKADRVPFPKMNLTYVASQLGIPTDRSHDALGDAITTAAVYRKLVTQPL